MKILIIGFGKMGEIRHEILSKSNLIKEIFIYDKNLSKIKNFNSKIKFIKTLSKLNLNELDAVFICTFVNSAPKFVKKFLSLKIPVFCEKPPSKNLKILKSIINVEKKYKSLLVYGFNHRYHNNIIFFKKILKKKYGKILWMRAEYGKAGSLDFHKNWRNFKKISGGGILIDQGIHILDLFNYITNTEFSLTHSISSKSFWKIEVEDNAFLTLVNKDNVIASMHSSANYWNHKFNIEICTENGFIELDGLITPSMTYAPEIVNYALKNRKTGQIKKFNKKIFNKDNSFKIETIKFLKKVQNSNINQLNYSNEALSIMKIIDRVYNQDAIKRNK